MKSRFVDESYIVYTFNKENKQNVEYCKTLEEALSIVKAVLPYFKQISILTSRNSYVMRFADGKVVYPIFVEEPIRDYTKTISYNAFRRWNSLSQQ